MLADRFVEQLTGDTKNQPAARGSGLASGRHMTLLERPGGLTSGNASIPAWDLVFVKAHWFAGGFAGDVASGSFGS
jgi:hypothetical protein